MEVQLTTFLEEGEDLATLVKHTVGDIKKLTFRFRSVLFHGFHRFRSVQFRFRSLSVY